MRQVRSSSERALRLAATAFAFIVICALAPARTAGALGLPTSFDMSPNSGPAGTKVNVNGDGCSPGLILGSSFVSVEASTEPPTSVRVPAQSNGSWSGSFTIPGTARAAPAGVTATCVSDSLLSLFTTYTPKTFTVTGSVVPTTRASPVPTPQVTSATTTLSYPGNPSHPAAPSPATSSQVPVPNKRVDNATARGSGGSGRGADGGRSSATGAASGKGDSESGPGARAAELTSPELSVSKTGDGAGLGWLLWVLALIVPVGGIALYVWMRRTRRPDVRDVEADAA